MPLRFTVTEKWQDKWFRLLKPKHKLLWIYLVDNCDQAGLIEFDVALWKMYVGTKFTEEEVLEVFQSRVVRVPNTNKIWIVKFIETQQRCKLSELNESNNAHKGILAVVKRYGLKRLAPSEGLTSPYGAPPEGPCNSIVTYSKDKKRDSIFPKKRLLKD